MKVYLDRIQMSSNDKNTEEYSMSYEKLELIIIKTQDSIF